MIKPFTEVKKVEIHFEKETVYGTITLNDGETIHRCYLGEIEEIYILGDDRPHKKYTIIEV